MKFEDKKIQTSISINSYQLNNMKNDILLNNNKKMLSKTIENQNKIFLFLLKNIIEKFIYNFTFSEFKKIGKIAYDNIPKIHHKIFENEIKISISSNETNIESNNFIESDEISIGSDDFIELDEINITLYKLIINKNNENNNQQEIMELHDIAKKIMELTNIETFGLIWLGLDYFSNNNIISASSYKEFFTSDLTENQKWETDIQIEHDLGLRPAYSNHQIEDDKTFNSSDKSIDETVIKEKIKSNDSKGKKE